MFLFLYYLVTCFDITKPKRLTLDVHLQLFTFLLISGNWLHCPLSLAYLCLTFNSPKWSLPYRQENSALQAPSVQGSILSWYNRFFIKWSTWHNITNWSHTIWPSYHDIYHHRMLSFYGFDFFWKRTRFSSPNHLIH